MTDQPSSPLPISDPYNVPITFAGSLLGVGHWNGVVNVTLGAPRFTPQMDGTEPDVVITSRLRMDLATAQSLHSALGRIIEQMLPPANATTH